jgi:WD40 repeat protein
MITNRPFSCFPLCRLFILSAALLSSVFSESAFAQSNGTAESFKPELVLQNGHSSLVTGVAFDPGGRFLASVSDDGTLKVWSLPEGYLLQTADIADLWSRVLPPDKKHLSGHLSSVTFLRNGNLVVVGWSGLVLLRFGSEGSRYLTMSGIVEGSLCADPRGRWVAVATSSGVTLISTDDLRIIRTLPSNSSRVLAVAVSPDGSRLGTGGTDAAITIWDPTTGKQLKTLRGHEDYVRSLAFNQDGNTLVSGSDDKTIRTWNAASGKPMNTLSSGSGIQSLVLSPDGLLVVSAGQDQEISLWSTKTETLLQSWKTAGQQRLIDFQIAQLHKAIWFPGGIAFGPDSQSLAIGGAGATEILDLKTMKLSLTLGTRADVVGAQFSPYSTNLALERERYLSLWDLGLGRPRATLWFAPGRSGSFNGAIFSPDGRTLAAGTMSTEVRIWDLKTHQVVRNIPTRGQIRALAFNPGGTRLATANVSGEIKIWDPASGKEIRSFSFPLNLGVPTVAFGIDGKTLAGASSRGNMISIFDAVTGNKTRDIDCEPPPELVTALRQVAEASGPCGVYGLTVDRSSGALSATGIFGARLWSDSDWTKPAVAFRNDLQSGGIAFGAKGRLWVQGGTVWDLSDHREVFNLGAYPGSPSFSYDSKWLASLGRGQVALWDVNQRKLAAILVYPEGGWLVVSPDGLFDGSPGSWSDILWRFGSQLQDVLPVEAFFSDFYYPGLLSDIAAGKSPKAPFEFSRLDRRQPVVELKLAEPMKEGPVSSRNVTLLLSADSALPDTQHPRPSGVRDLRLFRNGSLVKIWRGEISDKTTYKITLPIIAGNNLFTAYAFNDSNIKSRDAKLNVTGADTLARKGTAYIIAIGINKYSNPDFNLRYAGPDAGAFSRELREKQIQLGAFERVEIVPLYDQYARKTNVLAALHGLSGRQGSVTIGMPEELRRIKPAEPEDAVFIYFAGHGVSAHSHFYMIPYDLGYDGKREQLDDRAIGSVLANSISDDELLHAIEEIDAGKLVMIIDACNSGQALESEERRRGPMNSKGLAQLAYEKGMFLLTASEGYQAALEDAKLGHGILTYALVEEGLKTAAADEEPTDDQVDVREWLEYAASRVPEIQQSLESHARELEHVRAEDADAAVRRAEQDSSSQHPRLFYRREQESRPLIILRTLITISSTGVGMHDDQATADQTADQQATRNLQTECGGELVSSSKSGDHCDNLGGNYTCRVTYIGSCRIGR